MDRIILQRYSNKAIWVTADKTIQNKDEQFLVALAKFLGYDPAIVLNLESTDQTEVISDG